jgi:hypothetical protein
MPRKVDLGVYRSEVEHGLPLQQPDLDISIERQAFFDYDGFRFERRFRRDAESSFDFAGRSHRPSGFLRECIEILCEHLYVPGPSRRWSETAGDELLQRVYSDNLIDSIMFEADQLSSLNERVLIQIDPGEGDFALKPITYRLWGSEQFWVWSDPDNPTIPSVVCTKDKFDEQTRYRLWTAEEVQTFLTPKLKPLQTSGGRVAIPVGPPEPHGYGCLPFTLVSYKLPIRDLRVSCVGDLLWKAEIHIDDRLSRLDESIHKHLNPIPVAEGMPDQWKPILEPGRFIRMPLAAPAIGASGGYERGEFARLYYLSVTIDVGGAWEDCRNYMNQALEAARVPLSAARMEQSGVASGISLMVEQEPLLKRAERRRGPFRVYENDLGKRTLMVCGNHYGKAELVSAAAKGNLILGWPQARLAVNTPDKLELGASEVAMGLKSHLMLIMDWYGIGRTDALQMAEQIALDQTDLAAVNPEMAAARVMPPGPGGEESSDEEAGSGQTES